MSGAVNNPYKQEKPDKTLTQEGVSADAKAVGDALTLKKITTGLTVDQYNIAFFPYPKDFKMALQYICPDALLVPQVDYGSGMNFRCVGNTNSCRKAALCSLHRCFL